MSSHLKALVEGIGSVTAEAQLVYVFGSSGTAYERPDSDVDVAVLFPQPLSFEERVDLVTRLGDATGRTVDLVDLASADPIIRRQVIATGTVVHVGDQAARSRFEMKTLSEYADLKIDRRDAERRLAEAGP